MANLEVLGANRLIKDITLHKYTMALTQGIVHHQRPIHYTAHKLQRNKTINHMLGWKSAAVELT